MNDLAAKLRELAAHMREVAVELDYYGGFAPWAHIAIANSQQYEYNTG